MAVLIAAGTTAATSADFSLTDGQTTTLFLVDAAGDGVSSAHYANIQIKDSLGEYFNIGVLDVARPAQVLAAVGTFRVSKPASEAAFGVDRV